MKIKLLYFSLFLIFSSYAYAGDKTCPTGIGKDSQGNCTQIQNVSLCPTINVINNQLKRSNICPLVNRQWFGPAGIMPKVMCNELVANPKEYAKDAKEAIKLAEQCQKARYNCFQLTNVNQNFTYKNLTFKFDQAILGGNVVFPGDGRKFSLNYSGPKLVNGKCMYSYTGKGAGSKNNPGGVYGDFTLKVN